MRASRLNSRTLWEDFCALCDCGGRQAGSQGEAQAISLVQDRLARIGATSAIEIPYAGWRLKEAALLLPGGAPLACHPLLGTQSTPQSGIEADVVDLGRGAEEDFARQAERIAGRFVLVRHEYPFAPGHVHRRRKLGWAMERGAAGFIIAHPQAGGGPVSGSSGRGAGAGIPAVGTDFASAERLRTAGRAVLCVEGEDYRAQTRVLQLEIPGRSAQWVVLSAHVDGHDIGESAMDNASGVAVALAVALRCAEATARPLHGLRACIFSAEEWALAGSRHYVDGMSAEERAAHVVNVNLDTVGGASRLTALTSEFPQLEAFVREAGCGIGTYAPMMANSDHYNFARHGIPALRLVAGFNEPESNVRHILTPQDTRDKVLPSELANAVRVAEALVMRALERGV